MTDVDLLVAGAGGGLAGALRAAEGGAAVVVAEANPHYRRGNNTAMSTAMIPGPGSRYQRAAGVEDSPERFLADVAAKTHGEADAAVAGTLARVGAPLVEWLADRVGLPIELADVDYPGHSVRRVHTVPGHHGSALLRGLAEAAEADPRIDLLVPARLVDLARRRRGVAGAPAPPRRRGGGAHGAGRPARDQRLRRGPDARRAAPPRDRRRGLPRQRVRHRRRAAPRDRARRGGRAPSTPTRATPGSRPRRARW